VSGKSKLVAIDPEQIKDRTTETPIGPLKGCVGAIPGSGTYRAPCVKMGAFSSFLARALNHPVVDRTGLSGTYTFDLRWDPSEPLDLIPTIHHELGLNVENGKMPFDVFVVDHINLWPTEN
jgi:uncharacterized protein (TIGR03435 family)